MRHLSIVIRLLYLERKDYLPSLFSTTVNFLEDVHLQGRLWVFVKEYRLKVAYIEKSLEAVHSTITFCILQCFVVVDILRVG